MVREQLTARTLDEAVAMALRPDRASSYNTVFAHRDGRVANVEGSGGDAVVRPIGRRRDAGPHEPLRRAGDAPLRGGPGLRPALGGPVRAGLRAAGRRRRGRARAR